MNFRILRRGDSRIARNEQIFVCKNQAVGECLGAPENEWLSHAKEDDKGTSVLMIEDFHLDFSQKCDII